MMKLKIIQIVQNKDKVNYFFKHSDLLELRYEGFAVMRAEVKEKTTIKNVWKKIFSFLGYSDSQYRTILVKEPHNYKENEILNVELVPIEQMSDVYEIKEMK